MGSGSYSFVARAARADTLGYSTKSAPEIFQQTSINNAMSPHGVKLRESRDSEEHPNSLAIVLALDVTGSMGSVPHYLVKQGLPSLMEGIIKSGVEHPQVLFAGIGDHEVDKAPFQIGQFESSDELLDKWLTDLYLEGGGGGNEGESYLLAWYFAATRTSIDCFEKRNQKGFLFTVGDEPPLQSIPKRRLEQIFGKNGQYSDETALELISKAAKTYNVYHLNISETASGSRPIVVDTWTQLLRDNFRNVGRKEEVANLISQIVSANMPASNIKTSTQSKEEEML